MIVDVKKIIDLRMKLHRMPELADSEYKTSEEIQKFIDKFNPDSVINLSQTGKAFVFDSGKPGLTTMFRAELDALPIQEPENVFNKSLIDGVSHKCGHDGHMAILCGLAEAISNDRPESGKVVLLFQPAEETLTGAHNVMEDKNFKQIEPDYIFGLHNLPDYDEGALVIKDKNFTSATNGVTITLTGNTSHAATPEKALNPTEATYQLLKYFRQDILKEEYKDFVLATPVFVQIGTPDFGITPGTAEIKVTLRAYDYSDLDKLIGLVQDKVSDVATFYKLKYKITYTDDAPPVLNNKQAVEAVLEAAEDTNTKVIKIKEPFKWTEDFGYYTIKYKGCFWGIGSGNIKPLHDKYYEFPDNIIFPAIKLFYSIYKKTNK